MARFKTEEEYLNWCERMIGVLYYANIAGNNEGIKKVIAEIASTFHLSEGEHLISED